MHIIEPKINFLRFPPGNVPEPRPVDFLGVHLIEILP
jgi:hypothetical protein